MRGQHVHHRRQSLELSLPVILLTELEVGSEAWEGPREERPSAEGASLGAGGGDFLSSTQIEGLEEVAIFGGREGRALSPIGPRTKGPGTSGTRFVVDLYQDEDRRTLAIGSQGGLTFWHSEGGDIDILRHDGSSSIPVRHPPMSDSTLDWSLLGRRHSPQVAKAKRGGRRNGAGAREEELGPTIPEDSGIGASEGSGGRLGRLGIKINKGRYSRKTGRRGHRGGRKKKKGPGPLSEEDLAVVSGARGKAPGAPGAAEEAAGEESGPDRGTRGGGVPGETEDAGRRTTEEEEEDAWRKTTEEDDEEAGEKTATRMKKTGSRRRTRMVMVKEGRLLLDDKGPKHYGRAPSRMSRVWPRRDEVITPGMSDPNRNIIGYRSQEVPVASARTSGVFWATSRTRDNRRFPGTAEKTLQGQGLEYVSVEGTVGGEEEDPLLWPGVRPPEVGPR